MAGHIASPLSVEWCTEDKIIEAVHKVFGGPPELDPASNKHSRVRARVEYKLPDNDGLIDSWNFRTIFNNPPFGNAWWRPMTCVEGCPGPCYAAGSPKEFCACGATGKREYIYSLEGLSDKERRQWTHVSIADWVALAMRAHNFHQSQVQQLLPSAVATAHFQEMVFKTASAVCFPRGRLHYRLVEEVPDHHEDCAATHYFANAKKNKTKKKDLHSHEYLLEHFCTDQCPARSENRRKLVETNGPAPMDSAVVYWGSEPKLFDEVYTPIGKVLLL